VNRSSSQERLGKLQREYKLLDYKLTAGHALTEEQQQRLIWLKEEIQWIDQQITERKMRKWS
jgi:hypothetical protein